MITTKAIVKSTLHRWEETIVAKTAKWLPQSDAVRGMRRPHFWIITALMAFCTLLYYVNQTPLVSIPPFSYSFLTTVHDLDRTLFFVPIIYAALLFRVRGSLITSFAFLCVVLPRALLFSPYPDPVLRALLFVTFAAFISLLIATEANQIEKAHQEERRRIARELHDETSQALSALAVNLQVLLQMAEIIGIQDTEFKTRLKKTHSLAVQVGTEVSRLMANLRPTLLDTLGLVPAIRHHAETNLTPLGTNIAFEFEKVGKSLPPEVEVELFRWAQGAIGNIMQHSQAKKAAISLKREGDELVLRISDNGRGFDVTQLTKIEESGRGAGLFGMKERISLVGGSCSVESQPGQGTTVTARVPLTWSKAHAKDKGISGR